MNPLIRPWRQFFHFKGRATRTEYGLYHLTATLLFITLEFVFVSINVGISGGHPDTIPRSTGLMIGMINAVIVLVIIPLFYVGHIAIGVRRLHDHGEPGIKFLLTFIPLAGIIFWLMMVFTPGEDFENEYGPNPRKPEQIGQGDLGGVFS